ncbi:hypothetical protein [Kaistella sp.]|uniref:hypothetical protein n=1 Tax=Kaistella sp. TaxID=2782235 RepID=UPI003C48FC31
MFRKYISFYPLKYCFLLVSLTVFAQTAFYKSNLVFKDFQAQEPSSSLLISGNKILFSASNHKMYAINKDQLTTVCEANIGWKSNSALYLYKDTFLYGNDDKNGTVAQYDLNTCKIIKKLPFESINSEPHFVNNIMYSTILYDGGKLVAYNLNENKIIWQKNTGFGADVQPIYFKNKIIANAENDNWFEIDYNGNFLKAKSKSYIYIDSTKIDVKNYQFLTHDGKEISPKFLKKNKVAYSECQVKRSDNHTFLLSENQLFILGNNRKKILQLDLEAEFPTDIFTYDAYRTIIETQPENVWFCYQNYLIHYDFKNKKVLRKVDLTQWNPHQLVMDQRIIWLISKNDRQLYALDFEPNQQTADYIKAKADMEREINNPKPPDKKKIEAAKVAQEKYKNN